MHEWLTFIRTLLVPSNLFQVGLLWVMCYFILRFLRGSLGLGILRGVLFLALLGYLATRLMRGWLGFELPHLELLLRPSLPILILGLIIVFQPEIRRAFTRLGVNPAVEVLTKSHESRGRTISEAVERLQRRRVGALIAIERSVGLRGYMEGAVRLNAEVHPTLVESIFQTNGPLHDGAVIIRGNRIVAAGCLFPLTENPNINPSYGTRHRAAVGVTEETDAVAIVVSEETGNIAVAINGDLKRIQSPRELTGWIDESLATSTWREEAAL